MGYEPVWVVYLFRHEEIVGKVLLGFDADLALPSVYTGIAVIAFSFLAISVFLFPKKMNKIYTN
jgi:hypothetical protein